MRVRDTQAACFEEEYSFVCCGSANRFKGHDVLCSVFCVVHTKNGRFWFSISVDVVGNERLELVAGRARGLESDFLKRGRRFWSPAYAPEGLVVRACGVTGFYTSQTLDSVDYRVNDGAEEYFDCSVNFTHVVDRFSVSRWLTSVYVTHAVDLFLRITMVDF
ncbi:unnamed protein product [Ascophyllum nodosum]